MTKGFKTPAFWLGALTTAVAAMMGSGALDGGSVAAGATLVASALGAAGYTAWRTFKKVDAGSKPAWRTSEFWLSIATVVIGGLYASGVFADGGTASKVIGFAAMLLAAMGYTIPKPTSKA